MYKYSSESKLFPLCYATFRRVQFKIQLCQYRFIVNYRVPIGSSEVYSPLEKRCIVGPYVNYSRQHGIPVE